MRIERRSAVKLLAAAADCPTLPARAAARDDRRADVDWPRFLARHDMLWDRAPAAWDEAPFLGNGLLGALLFYSEAEGAWRPEVSRSDVQDHRTPIRQTGIGRGRLPFGHFLLCTRGRPAGAPDLRLVLHDAMLVARLRTDRGEVRLRAYVHAEDEVIVVETRACGDETGARWSFVGEEAVSPRVTWAEKMNDARAKANDYVPNPQGRRLTDGGEDLWLQRLTVGGATATAWRQHGGRLLVGIAHVWPGDLPVAPARDAVRRAAANPGLERRHLRWRHAYYPASFVSIPDTRIESFYKEGGPVIETPLSSAQSLHDMLLQSWGDTIRPFPAVPGEWADCVFSDLGAEGGFLVSARREGERTRWIEVTSKAGEPFAVTTDMATPAATVNGAPHALTRAAGGRITCALARDETIVIVSDGTRPDRRVAPVRPGIVNSFGLNARNPDVIDRDLRLYHG